MARLSPDWSLSLCGLFRTWHWLQFLFSCAADPGSAYGVLFLTAAPVSFQEWSNFALVQGKKGWWPAGVIASVFPNLFSLLQKWNRYNPLCYVVSIHTQHWRDQIMELGVSTCRSQDQIWLTVVMIKTGCNWMVLSVSCEKREYWFSQIQSLSF